MCDFFFNFYFVCVCVCVVFFYFFGGGGLILRPTKWNQSMHGISYVVVLIIMFRPLRSSMVLESCDGPLPFKLWSNAFQLEYSHPCGEVSLEDSQAEINPLNTLIYKNCMSTHIYSFLMQYKGLTPHIHSMHLKFYF